MSKLNFSYLLLLGSSILLILNVVRLDFNNFQYGALFGIASNLCLMILAIMTIKNIKKVQ